MVAYCDSVIDQSQNNGYDEFDRLISVNQVNGSGPGSYTYTYDRWGNRLSQTSASGGPSPSTPVNAANNQMIGHSYDAAGNLLGDGIAHSFTYDAEGNIHNVDGGSSGTYVYDALNHRVSSQTPSGTLEYLFDHLGQRTSTWLASVNVGIEGRIYAGGKQIAFRAVNGQTYFDHQSVLGTERLRTNYGAAVAVTEGSLSFGDGFTQNVIASGSDQDENQYAGLDHDIESLSEHAQFRQYSSTQGRWMSPDPYDGSMDLGNPQSLNRYAYVLNNPMSYIDLRGLFPCLPAPVADPLTTISACVGTTVGDFVCGPVCGAALGGLLGGVTLLGELIGGLFAHPAFHGSLKPRPNAPSNDSKIPSRCKAAVLGAVNSQFGTNFNDANVQSSFMNGGGANLVINAGGLPAGQFNGLQTGRYASGLLNLITGVGPSLHLAGYDPVNDPNAIFNNSNIGGATSVTFTAHTDSAFANNPFGALLHYILDVSKQGKATRDPCPVPGS